VPKEKKKLSKAALQRERTAKKNKLSLEKRQKAIEFYQSGMIPIRISEELQVTPPTVTRWLKEAGVRDERRTRNIGPEEDTFTPYTIGEVEEANAKDEFEERLEQETDTTIGDALIQARDEEQQSLLEIAQNQASPADKYQAYIAASGIKMLRDNLQNVRGPRTIRELSELDQLIRRSLGLNPKGGTAGSGSLTIDINVLNNTKADLSKNRTVIDAQPVDDDSDYEYDG